MKKIIIISFFLSTFFSCNKSTESAETSEVTTIQNEPEPEEILDRKFEDKAGCSYYANLYAALPHEDSYKNMNFGKMDCLINKEKTGMPPNIKVEYFDKKTNDNFELQIFEISGEFAKEELNNVNMAKTSYNEITKIAGANTYKSSIKAFDNASVKIEESNTSGEKSLAVYLATYKDKYAIWINIKLDGKIDLAKVDAFIKEYLEGFKFDELK
jgi:hypothetical protein